MRHILKTIEGEIPRLRRYARALTRNQHSADDLVQEALLRAIEKLHLWQPGTNIRAWLFTIVHNQYVNHVRHAMRRGRFVEYKDGHPALTTPPAQGKGLEIRDLELALARIPDEQRIVVLLIGLEGLSYEEAAIVLDVPIGTIRSRLSRGRENLRRLIGDVDCSADDDAEAPNICNPGASRPRRAPSQPAVSDP